MNWKATAVLIVTSCSLTAMAQEGAKDIPKFRLCHTTYALCTFAQCGPAKGPEKHETTTCSCNVWQGYSVAAYSPDGKECDGAKEKDGQTIVISRYYPIPGYATCSDQNQPWAMCLNKKCTVDDKNKTKANCTCDVKKDQGEYLAKYGPVCSKGIVSSATVGDLDAITHFLKGRDEIPVQDFIVYNSTQ